MRDAAIQIREQRGPVYNLYLKRTTEAHRLYVQQRLAEIDQQARQAEQAQSQ
jgi:hypothetical protein